MRRVINVGGISNMYKILIIKLDGRNPIGRSSMKWDDKIVDWVHIYMCVCVGACMRTCLCERERECAQYCVLVRVIMNLGGFVEDWKFLV